MKNLKNTLIALTSISLLAFSLSASAWSVTNNPDGSNSYVVHSGNSRSGDKIVIHVKSKRAGEKLAKALNKADKKDKAE